jgi:hypothetical protein
MKLQVKINLWLINKCRHCISISFNQCKITEQQSFNWWLISRIFYEYPLLNQNIAYWTTESCLFIAPTISIPYFKGQTIVLMNEKNTTKQAIYVIRKTQSKKSMKSITTSMDHSIGWPSNSCYLHYYFSYSWILQFLFFWFSDDITASVSLRWGLRFIPNSRGTKVKLLPILSSNLQSNIFVLCAQLTVWLSSTRLRY